MKLQIIFPYRRDLTEDERWPVVLFVPGAAWYRQEMYNSVPQWARLAERGVVVAAVQVRSSAEAKFPAQLEDLLAAMHSLARDAARWHIDPDRMFLAGNSSGAHIALMTALTHGAAMADAPFRLRGVITLSAPTDMALCGGQPSLDLLGLGSLDEAPEQVAAASCGPLIDRGARLPRALLIHGTADTVVAPVHSIRLHRQLREAGIPSRLLLASGEGHGGAWPWRPRILDGMMRFISRADNCV